MKNWTRPLLAVLVMIGAGNAQAVVYKTVDAAGNTVYTDSPSKNAKEVNLPPLTIVPSIPVDAAPQQEPAAARPNRYFINFISPMEGQVLKKPDNVDINVDVKPELAPGDKLIILWDGNPIATGNSADVNTEQVDRGEHVVTARVTSPQGRTISEKSATVNIQQGSVNSPANQAKQPKPGKK